MHSVDIKRQTIINKKKLLIKVNNSIKLSAATVYFPFVFMLYSALSLLFLDCIVYSRFAGVGSR